MLPTEPPQPCSCTRRHWTLGGVPAVAHALGIAETTAKTHLGHLYEKTGAGRQADLVKLVAEFSNRLLG